MLDITEGNRIGRRSRRESIGKRLMEELGQRSWSAGAGREAERRRLWESRGIEAGLQGRRTGVLTGLLTVVQDSRGSDTPPFQDNPE